MNNKIRTFRKIKHHNDRNDLYQISYRDPQFTPYERHRKISKKYTTEIESEEEIYEPPTKMIDITKLPNGQFKDLSQLLYILGYLHTDEQFFVSMGGKNRSQIAEKLKQRSIDRASPNKFKENPFLNHLIIKRALDTQSGKRSMISLKSSMTLTKFKPYNYNPIEFKEPILPRTPSFTSARQKLFKILCNK